jgi:hypothetical protein
MNSVNKAWDMVSSYADLFRSLFCCDPEELDGEKMLSLFKTNFSDQGSNQRALEEISIFGWETFIQCIEGEFDFIVFIKHRV